ncbi:MAG: sigma-54-dependent Fis family transcriptional regulator [Candidatus Aminicenantes bacterium]|nr:sigma-54-dependent Fis family transcriptional regulator [Candidatus Aminicenantes bacterium]
MVQRIKRKVQEMLDRKQVSVAMIYDRNGHILWRHGRDINGRSIGEASGFCRAAVEESLTHGRSICRDPVSMYTSSRKNKNDSDSRGYGSVMIQPLDSSYFFYVDSGPDREFSAEDRRAFQLIFEIMDEVVEHIRQSQRGMGGITGESPIIKDLRDQVLRFAVEDEPVLLTGETGVGKNHVATLIHQYSGRRGPFVVAHTPAIPEQLFEREFFGHCRGAFTDARSDRRGLVAGAQGGTLFLDEITEVPVSFQAKLLRFIESGKFRPLGEVREKQSDVRVISATNRDVLRMVNEGLFREDLFYRIQVLQIGIPPLRERPQDIRHLVDTHQHFLKGKELTPGFWDVMLSHDWPGNIRELFTVLKRAGILLQSPISAEGIRLVINHGCLREKATSVNNCRVKEAWRRLHEGETFWEAVRKPFLARDLNRPEVIELIDRALRLGRGRYRNILELFNLSAQEYKRFMNFVHQHRLRPTACCSKPE